jgi:hypothetical protein
MARKSTPGTPAKDKTTIYLPPDLKLKAKLHAVRTGKDLGELIAEGLKLVLARDGGK